ncbi:hypothetical protein KR222_010730, partial [Zaprionus bogoriensis]
RKAKLLPPKGGTQMSRDEVYVRLVKNMSSFAIGSIVEVAMMHLNIAENCIFVGKWGDDTLPLKKLLACQMPLQEIHRLPCFGEIFAIHDVQDRIIPRVLINAHTEGGGYDAYLLDYGEHIHLTGGEIIFALPPEVQALPAEAIRCYVRNRQVSTMKKYICKTVRLRVVEKNEHELIAEIPEDNQCGDDVSTESVQNVPGEGKEDTILAEPLPECSYEAPVPGELGSTVRVLVTNIQSPIQLYVQFVDNMASPLVWSTKEVPEEQRVFKRAPLLLDMVLALYSDDCYYRAQIVEVIDSMYKIFYVDYGNTEFVGIKSLAQCSNAVSLKPHQAVCCFIQGVKLCATTDQTKSVECVEFLKSKVLNCQFDVVLVDRLPDG